MSSPITYIGTIALVAGGTAGGLGILDWCLSKKTKLQIADAVETLWLWLSYQRTWPYIQKLRDSKAFDLLFASAIILMMNGFIVSFYLLGNTDSDPDPPTWFAPIAIAIFVIVPTAIYYFLRMRVLGAYVWIIRPGVSSALFGRALLAIGALYGGLFILLGTGVGLGFLVTKVPHAAYTVLIVPYALFFIVVWALGVFGFFVLYALFLLAMYIGLIYGLIGAMSVLQFVVLRIVEFDKGPLLGIAALLTGIGAVAKALVG